MNKLLLIGAGGLARECAAWAENSKGFGTEWKIAGHLDDNVEAFAGKNSPYPILGTVKDWTPKEDEVFLIAVGYPHVKRKLFSLLNSKGAKFASLVHKTAILGHNVQLGLGCCIGPYAILSGYNKVGSFSTVYFHSSLDHDVEIGSFCQISAHCDLTGGVQLADDVFVGSSACFLPGVNVGAGAIIGAGSVVTKDVSPGSTVAGTPARNLKSHE